MPKIFNIAVPAALLLSALTLSACASKQEPAPVATPAAAEVTPEKTPVAEVTPEPAAAFVATAKQPAAPKHKAKKARKMPAKQAEPVTPPPAPVAAPEPAPVVKQEAPVVTQAEPAPVPVAPPVKAEPGFLEQYWMWLLGLLIVIVGAFAWWKKNQG